MEHLDQPPIDWAGIALCVLYSCAIALILPASVFVARWILF